MKKVVLFTNSFGCGGTERVISRLIPRLNELYDVRLVVLDSSKIEYETEVPIVSLGGAEKKNRIAYGLSLIGKIRRFSDYIKSEKIDCVVSFLSVPNIINIIANKNAKTIISIRGQLKVKGGLSSKIKHQIEKMTYRKADGVIVPSRSLRDDLVNIFNVDDKKIAVIYNPFDVSDIKRMSEDEISPEYRDIFANNRVIVALGRMTYEKGYKYLLESFRYVLETEKAVKLFIIGDGGLMEEIRSQTVSQGIENDVILAGKMSNPFPYIRESTLYVMSSISEGFPNSLVEAMACEKAVISTDCKSGPREILDINEEINPSDEIEFLEYGVLVPSFDENCASKQIKIFSEAVIVLLQDEQRRREYEKKSICRAKEFTVDSCIDKYKRVIDR